MHIKRGSSDLMTEHESFMVAFSRPTSHPLWNRIAYCLPRGRHHTSNLAWNEAGWRDYAFYCLSAYGYPAYNTCNWAISQMTLFCYLQLVDVLICSRRWGPGWSGGRMQQPWSIATTRKKPGTWRAVTTPGWAKLPTAPRVSVHSHLGFMYQWCQFWCIHQAVFWQLTSISHTSSSSLHDCSFRTRLNS